MNWLKQQLKRGFNLNPRDWLGLAMQSRRLSRAEPAAPDAKGTALVWFSYAGDLNLLAASIKSADLFASASIDQLVIVQDCSAPFSDQQLAELASLSSLPLTLLDSASPLGWAGVSTITSELEAYQTIFSTLKVEWLVKLDSDALVIAERLFIALASLPQKPLLVGQSARALYQQNPTTLHADWAQGGCYALNAAGFEAMKKASLPKAALNTLKVVPLTLKDLPEDVFFSQLAELASLDISYLPCHYPIWLRGDLHPPITVPGEHYYSVLHFEGCKAQQEDTLVALILSQDPQGYLDNQWQQQSKQKKEHS